MLISYIIVNISNDYHRYKITVFCYQRQRCTWYHCAREQNAYWWPIAKRTVACQCQKSKTYVNVSQRCDVKVCLYFYLVFLIIRYIVMVNMELQMVIIMKNNVPTYSTTSKNKFSCKKPGCGVCKWPHGPLIRHTNTCIISLILWYQLDFTTNSLHSESSE